MKTYTNHLKSGRGVRQEQPSSVDLPAEDSVLAHAFGAKVGPVGSMDTGSIPEGDLHEWVRLRH